jgi:hypothetical protein
MPTWGAPLRYGVQTLRRARRGGLNVRRQLQSLIYAIVFAVARSHPFIAAVVTLLTPFIGDFFTEWEKKQREWEEAKINNEMWRLRVDILPLDMAKFNRDRYDEYKSIAPS